MPAGRPTKYREEMNDTALNLMKEGASIVEVCAELEISRETLYDWCNPESERHIKVFSDTIRRGKVLCQAWWERQGRLNLSAKEFQTGLWNQNMKCRFPNDWIPTEKKETKVEVADKAIEFVVKSS